MVQVTVSDNWFYYAWSIIGGCGGVLIALGMFIERVRKDKYQPRGDYQLAKVAEAEKEAIHTRIDYLTKGVDEIKESIQIIVHHIENGNTL